MLVTDAVCLKVLDHNHLLLAVGNSLHHYHQRDNGPTSSDGNPATVRIYADLLPDHIHGILSVPHGGSADELCIVAFGGRSLVQLRLRRSDGRLLRQRSTITARLSDWISSAHLHAATGGADGGNTETVLVLLTCQCTVVWLALGWTRVTDDVDPVSERPRIVRTVGGPDQTTLYCSRIVCGADAGDELMSTFLGGTAFGELIVWRMVDAGADGAVSAQQLQRISCHNGVIFSIDCDPRQRLLTTTSDDRSVKVWRLDDGPAAASDWSMTLQRTLFAHTSRVFRSRLLPGGRLLSGGEDGQLCLWLAESGALLARQSLDTGALWHIDYEPRSQMAVVATAGGNCKQFSVAAYQRAGGQPHSESEQQRQLQNGTAAEVSVESLRLPAGEHVVKVRFVAAPCQQSDPHLVIVTNRNRLVVGQPVTARWLFVADAVPFKIGVLETSGRYVAVAGHRQCCVFEYTGEALQRCWNTDVAGGGGAATSMVRTVQFTDGGPFADVLIGDSAGNAELHIDWMVGRQARSVGLRMVPCREPWATAICRPGERDVLIGDRCGHLHLYTLDCVDGEYTMTLRDTLRHVHGRNAGITSLLPQRRGVVLCGGHDGTVKCIRYTDGGLQVLQTVAVPMSWVQSIRCDEHGFVAVGFESNRCVVWSSRQQETLAVIECGGGHRFADVHLSESLAGSGHFAYLRRNVLRWLRFDMTPPSAFRSPATPNNWHSLSCTCVEVLPLTGPCGADLIVSGGDDNLLKFHVLRHAGPTPLAAAATLTFLANVGTHVSSIKTLAIERPAAASRNPNAWRIISAGGRAQICITDVEFPPEYCGQLTDRRFQVHQRSVCGRQKGTRNTNHVSAVEGDAPTTAAAAGHTDTRIMSVATFDGCTGFVAGCSTGLLRTFTYRDEDDGGRLTVDSTAEYGRCILKVLVIASADRRRTVVVTAATDGRVCLWLASHESEAWHLATLPFAHMAHHQSGVQSMDWMRSADPHHFQLVTGGDDQSVVVSRFGMQLPDDDDDDPHVSDVRTQSLAARHSAQVNGVRFGSDGRRLYTTGVDQTVWLWQPDEQSAWRPQRLVGRTAVADVKGVQVCSERAPDAADRVLVFGYGVQMLDATR